MDAFNPTFPEVAAASPAMSAERPLGAGLDFTDPASPLARYYARGSHVAAAALLGLVFLVVSRIPLWHTDIWGHLAYGRWIVNHGGLPASEPLCPYADPGAEALHAYWLSQCGLYELYQLGERLAGGDAIHRTAGGVELLRGGFALLLVLRCIVLVMSFRRRGGSLGLACIGLGLLIALSIGSLAVLRPQVIGEFFFACLLLVLSRPALSRRALVLAPLILVLWVNCHGSYLMGLGLLAVFLIGRSTEAGWRDGRWRPRAALADPQARRLALLLAACVVAVGLANPHGPAIYGITLRMGQHPNVIAMDEWPNRPTGKP
jgi:hypothetical protein